MAARRWEKNIHNFKRPCSVLFITVNTNEIQNHFSWLAVVFLLPNAQYLSCSLRNTDLFKCEDNMLHIISHVKIIVKMFSHKKLTWYFIGVPFSLQLLWTKDLVIGHFQVPLGLCFKTRVGACPLIWKSFFILMEIKLISQERLCT